MESAREFQEIENNELNVNKSRSYRFWPLFAMSFLRTFFFALYSLALPNYLIYIHHLSSGLVGTVSSVSSIAYIIGPFIGRKVTKKLGIRNTLILSHSVSVASIIISITFVNPPTLIICRAADGFMNGFFWPNVLNMLSNWEKHTQSDKGLKKITRKKKVKEIDFLKIFNLSWNFGLIGGFIIGYVFVSLTGSDYYALILSAIFASLLIPAALSLERSEKFEIINNRAVVLQDFKLRFKEMPSKIKTTTIINASTPDLEKPKSSLHHVPIMLAWGGILVYASTKSIFKFTLPYFFQMNDMESSWVYGVVLFQQISQILALTFIQRVKKKRYSYFISMGLLMGFTVIFMFNPSILLIGLINIAAGFCIGLMQGVTQRIVLDYGKHRNSTKYSMWNEVFSGISFGLAPMIAGFLNEINIVYDFVFLGVELTVLFIILVINHLSYREQEKKGVFLND
ncbi:MAG: MFS transporter [Promethearchaeota archaeon]